MTGSSGIQLAPNWHNRGRSSALTLAPGISKLVEVFGFLPTRLTQVTVPHETTSPPRPSHLVVIALCDCQYCWQIHGCMHTDGSTRGCARDCGWATCELPGQRLPRTTGICRPCLVAHHPELLAELEAD